LTLLAGQQQWCPACKTNPTASITQLLLWGIQPAPEQYPEIYFSQKLKLAVAIKVLLTPFIIQQANTILMKTKAIQERTLFTVIMFSTA